MESYVRDVDVLDSLLRRLLSTDWNEKIRGQAVEKAAWIATHPAPRNARVLSRGIVSLLHLADEELRPEAETRLLELIGEMRESRPPGG